MRTAKLAKNAKEEKRKARQGKGTEMREGDPKTPKRNEPPAEVDQLAYQLIGAAMEVHSTLGPGYLEAVYEEALCVELEERSIPFKRQAAFAINYKGRTVGEGRLDVLVGGKLIVELKAVDAILPIHEAQVLSYLKATGHPLALVINFNVRVLKDGIKRWILS